MRQQDYLLVALETENVTMGAWGLLIHLFVFLNMFDVTSNKTKKKKIVTITAPILKKDGSPNCPVSII